MPFHAITYTLLDDVATVHFDDGKVNALSYDAMAAMHDAIDKAEAEARAVIFAGREGKFCAGFDLAEVQAGPDATRAIVKTGAELFLRLYDLPIPTIAACTGHALAAGAIWLMSVDVRIGADVKAKIGLNETAIGLSLPLYATELARDRLSKRHFTSATALATLYSPAEAVDVGYLDRVVAADCLDAEVAAVAANIASTLDPAAFAATRRTTRGATLMLLRDTLTADMAALIAREMS